MILLDRKAHAALSSGARSPGYAGLRSVLKLSVQTSPPCIGPGQELTLGSSSETFPASIPLAGRAGRMPHCLLNA